MNAVLVWAQAHPLLTAVAAVLLLAAVALLVRSGRKAARRTPAAVMVAALAAMACTSYSADTSWRFARDRLGMVSAGERGAMFAAAELALFACALMARQNLNTQGAPGTPGVLVWFITGVQVIPAYSESGVIGGTVRAVVGPVLAALLWHLAMGIELRHAKPGADSGSLPALIARELRERLLSRLGLAVRDRTAEQITRDRATARAVQLASRPKLRRWGSSRLAAAVARSGVATDPQQLDAMMRLLSARRGAGTLGTIPLPSLFESAVTVEVDRAPDAPEVHPAIETAVPEVYPEPSNAVPAGVRLLPVVARPEASRQREACAAEPPRTRPEVRAEYVPEPAIEPVPDWTVPGDYADEHGQPAEPEEEVEYPDPLIPKVRADFPDEVPGVRRLKETYSIGQPRAQRIRDELTGVRS
ncbi:hypothetical protein [Streptomyces hokutonensis]|uniref:Integral membrane protein n=1 Tax=Streptomyces hokutonensis TaxID=1306990 RepID=A0ABW6M9N0_9ACTN